MDSDTRVKELEARIAKLEALAEDTANRVQSAVSKLKSHPLLGSFVRMFEE